MRKIVIALAMTVLVGGNTADAAVILDHELDFNTLPSAQGWTYDGNTPETDFCSVDGTRLLIDTMSLGVIASDRSRYFYDLSSYSGVAYWRATFVVRVTEYERDSQYDPWHYGFVGSVAIGGYGAYFGVSTDYLQGPGNFFNGLPVDVFPIVGASWHEIQMLGDMIQQTYAIYVDDQLAWSGPMVVSPNARMEIGDGSGVSNANMEIEHVGLVLSDQPVVAVEPSAFGTVKALFR